MILFKIEMVLFSLYYVSNGKDYLVELEDGDFKENKFVFPSMSSSSVEINARFCILYAGFWFVDWRSHTGLCHCRQDCQLATTLPLCGVSKQAESDSWQGVRPLTAQRSVTSDMFILWTSFWISLPSELHPIFYGCYDWHSSVHGHWLLAQALAMFPGTELADNITKGLSESYPLCNFKLTHF